MADGNEALGATAPHPLLPLRDEPDLRDRDDDKHADEQRIGKSTTGAAEGDFHEARENPTSPAATLNEPRSMTEASSTAFPKAFERLPDEIIQKILLTADPSAFASLVLLNSKWRGVSQQAHLYAHHLTRSPVQLTSNDNILTARLREFQQTQRDGTSDFNGLYRRLLCDMRRAFAQKIKRCLFDAYLRPSRTLIRIVSNTSSSSSAPGGEDIQFQASQRGHHLLAYNSSRIYVLDVRSVTAPHGVEVIRELKVLRRPLATCLCEDALFLAVLLTEMQVDLYDLQERPPRRIQSIILDNSPRAIALSPCGSVLAVAFEGGIEVFSLYPDALSTSRRAVKCDPVDALAFSSDGTQILGTSTYGARPNTVILTAPYFDPGTQISSDDLGALWTTSILFPNTSHDCSHAVFLRDPSREEACWTAAYDRRSKTFRAIRIDDLRNGTTYFTGPMSAAASSGCLLPSTLPSVSCDGDLVAAGFSGRDVLLYRVPENQDMSCTGSSGSESMDPGAPGGFEGMGRSLMGNSTNNMDDAGLCSSTLSSNITSNDKVLSRANSVTSRTNSRSTRRKENTFIDGVCVGELPGADMASWVESFNPHSIRERLLIGARGVHPPTLHASEVNSVDFIDGGRLLVVDFDYGISNGTTTEIIIEVGSKEPELLEEEHRDIDVEVAIVRRRTVAQKRGEPGSSTALLRNATTAGVLGQYSSTRTLPRLRPAMPVTPPVLPRLQIARTPQDTLAASASRNAMCSSTANGDKEADDSMLRRSVADPPISCRQDLALVEPAATRLTAGAATAIENVHTPVDGESDAIAPNNHRAVTESIAGEEEQEAIEAALDAPYSHDSPRSGMTLQRAATAAAMNRRRHPVPATTTSGQPIVYRRADGRREHPHESDADNWVPPPPPYQKEVDPQDLPAFLRHNVPPVAAPGTNATVPTTVLITSTSTSITGASAAKKIVGPALVAHAEQGKHESGHQTALGDCGEAIGADNMPISRPASYGDTGDVSSGDLYDASPPGSPSPPAAVVGVPQQQQQSQQLPPPQVPYESDFVPRPVTSVQTWPLQWPSHSTPDQTIPDVTCPDRYTTSHRTADSTTTVSNVSSCQQDQLSPCRPVGGQQVVQALSSNRHSIGSFAVPRVPVGSNRHFHRVSVGQPSMQGQPGPAALSSGKASYAPWDMNMPLLRSQEAAESQQSRQVEPHSQQPQQPYDHFSPPQFHQPLRSSSNPVLPNASLASTFVEDQPLIISTPRGLTGAFDDSPKRGKSDQHRLDEFDNGPGPVIFAPVPRHPQVQERNAELRERLETLSGGGAPMAPIQRPLILPFSPDRDPESPETRVAGTSSLTRRHPSLNHRQRRAKRSPAKDLLTVKKRGWRRRASKRETRNTKPVGIAGADSAMATSSRDDCIQQPSTSGHEQQQHLQPLQGTQAVEKRSVKCIIM
ncbi:hypothetical protein SEPCBS57363_002366 [Sporothrix epigloea]|uniref:F-box domain-containing protein n=1 Tax=Sporothrix epigloea TaxID=1892477 RepID=A0ABP0DFH1_9PEZI